MLTSIDHVRRLETAFAVAESGYGEMARLAMEASKTAYDGMTLDLWREYTGHAWSTLSILHEVLLRQLESLGVNTPQRAEALGLRWYQHRTGLDLRRAKDEGKWIMPRRETTIAELTAVA